MNIWDYLHFYIGCKVHHPALRNIQVLNGRLYQSWKEAGTIIVPILRPLSSITDEEIANASFSSRRHFDSYCEHHDGAFHPEDFAYLLSLGFDLFGLIPAGLALDATTNETGGEG
jgi:hypothetical protein